jgi:hypothetical protein
MSSRQKVVLGIRAVQVWVAVFSAAYFLVLLGTCALANHTVKASAKAYQTIQALLFGRLGIVLTDAQLGFWAITSLALGILYLIGRAESKHARFTVHEGGKKKAPQPQTARATVLTFRREK